jgi:hypothetical protein
MLESPFEEVVKYLRDIRGLNMVLTGTPEQRGAKLSLKLQDTTADAVLEHVTRQVGYTWEVDRFGIAAIRPPKK